MHWNEDAARIEWSVPELCAAALRRGSLDARRPSVMRSETDAEGGALRRAYLERRMGADNTEGVGDRYQAHTPLRHQCHYGAVSLYVSGVADGVAQNEQGLYLVERVRTTSSYAWYGSAEAQDRAMLVCYGFLLASMKRLPRVVLRMTYLNDEEGARSSDTLMTTESLRAAYLELLAKVYDVSLDRMTRETTVRQAAREAAFPYSSLREGQDEMVRTCWRNLRHGRISFIQAPTGIGKTMSTLYPAVRCYGERRCDKVFYLTAKSSVRREALSAVARLNDTGTPIRACVIAARQTMCCHQQGGKAGKGSRRFCRPDACPYARGYYDRLWSACSELLRGGTRYDEVLIGRVARRHQVCPYELSLDLSEFCEVILCDYNYVFSPTTYLRRYFAEGTAGVLGRQYMLLVDEAHNLPDRTRDMYSGTLSLVALSRCAAQITAYEAAQCVEDRRRIFPEEDDAALRMRGLGAEHISEVMALLDARRGLCRDTMQEMSDGCLCGVHLEQTLPEELSRSVDALGRRCERWLRKNNDHPLYEVVEALAEELRSYRTAAERYDGHYVTFTDVRGEDVQVRLMCLDPATQLASIWEKFHGAILFSATLTPTDYFAELLGGGRRTATASFPSPFPQDHLCVAVVDRISTRYEHRKRSCRQIVSCIAATVAAAVGNYLVYAPSYAYLEEVYREFVRRYPKVRTILQMPGMDRAHRDAFLSAFQTEPSKRLVGFCVLGGMFSEGVDLPGRCLIGAVIIGVGVPSLSSERNIIREYYDRRNEDDEEGDQSTSGYAYAYRYPGMNHVLQAAGRVIRRDEDRGVVVLIDDRYTTEEYLSLYPAHWRSMQAVGDAASLSQVIRRFWDS